MAKDPYILYRKKFDHEPAIKGGRELVTTDYQTGWVEYMLATSDLYWIVGLDPASVRDLVVTTTNCRLPYFLKENKILEIGFIKALIAVRREEEFTLPIFGNFLKRDVTDKKNASFLSCGGSRFIANHLSGADLSGLSVIWQVEKGKKFIPPGDHVKITSTLQVEELCRIEDVEYSLVFSETGSRPIVSNSFIRATPYDLSTNNKKIDFEVLGGECMGFWLRFRNAINDNKIRITVRCSEDHRHLVEFDEDLWEVTFLDNEHKDFSFQYVLSKFASIHQSQLTLEVRGISSPFKLEYLVPMIDKNSVWYYTQDKKICMYDTTQGAASATWPITEWGNFAK